MFNPNPNPNKEKREVSAPRMDNKKTHYLVKPHFCSFLFSRADLFSKSMVPTEAKNLERGYRYPRSKRVANVGTVPT